MNVFILFNVNEFAVESIVGVYKSRKDAWEMKESFGSDSVKYHIESFEIII